ncbi:MAG: hypothetical protein U0167_10250 [bacterium]
MKRAISVLAGLSLLLLFAASASSDPKPTAARPPVVKDHAPQPVPNPIHVDQGGDTIATATPIPSLPYSDSGTTVGYEEDYNLGCAFGDAARDVVYSYTPTADIHVDIDLCGSSYNTMLYVLQDDASNRIACNDDFCGLQSALHHLALTTGHTYYIVVDGFEWTSMGPYTLHVALNDCPVDCPPGSLLEGEPICSDGYRDAFNGGCNSVPPVFSPLDCSPTGVVTVCGTYGGFYLEGFTYRDTDWYQIVIPPGPDKLIGWTVRGETDTLAGIIDGRGGCPVTTFYEYAYGASCADITVARTLAPGTWWLWVGPLNFGSEAGPCGQNYVATLSGFQCQPVAVEPTTWGRIKTIYR